MRGDAVPTTMRAVTADPTGRLLADRGLVERLGAFAIPEGTLTSIPLGLDRDAPAGSVVLTARSRRGVLARALLDTRRDLWALGGRGPDSHWSDVVEASSEVIVAPDAATGIALTALLSEAGTAPFVIATPLLGPPHGWRDAAYWTAFGRVIVLADDLFANDPVLAAVAAGNAAGAVALPPDGGWRTAVRGGRLQVAELVAIVDGAVPLTRLGSLAGVSHSVTTPVEPHGVDHLGRLLRVVEIEVCRDGGAVRGNVVTRQRVQVVVRSDRALLRPRAVPAPAGTLAGRRLVELEDGTGLARWPSPAMVCSWSPDGLRQFLAGRLTDWREEGARLLVELAGLIRAGVGADDMSAGRLAGFVAAGYVYRLVGAMPTLYCSAREPGVGLAVCKFMAAISHRAHRVGRERARSIARLADATGGTLILEDPGCLVGPSGPTEIGRFLLDSARPGPSAMIELGAGDARGLQVFGPRMVLSSMPGGALGLAGVMVMVDPIASTMAIPSAWNAQDLVDRLYSWSMDVAEAVGDDEDVSADLVAMLAPWSSLGPSQSVAADCADVHEVGGLLGGGNAVDPVALMGTAFDRCSSGRTDLTLAELALEAALDGGVGDAFSAERIGRWLSRRPQIDPSRPVVRRRLYGEIMRIYPLRNGGESKGDEPFGFCGSPCATCRFDRVCGEVMPALRIAKSRRSK